MLDRAEQPERVVAVALEGQHRVDEVLEQAGPGQRPVLRDVTHEHRGDATRLGLLHEPVGRLAHLSDAARRRS